MALFPFENSPNIPKQVKSGNENPFSITQVVELINQISGTSNRPADKT
jgi:hypothetical protein